MKAVHLDPFVSVNAIGFAESMADISHRLGRPSCKSRNAIDLLEWDYGDKVLRFQESGRLEEITLKAPVLTMGPLAIPFASLAAFVHNHDKDAFTRAGFVVSPRYGMAFVPDEPCWITALAKHCLVQWLELPH